MPVKLKKKIKTKSQSGNIITPEIRQKAQDYLETEKRIRKLDALLKVQAQLKKELLEFADEVRRDDQELNIKTPSGFVRISGKGKSRRITSMKKVRKILGKELFLKLASVTLSDLDKYMTPDQLEECVEETTAGSRRVKADLA